MRRRRRPSRAACARPLRRIVRAPHGRRRPRHPHPPPTRRPRPRGPRRACTRRLGVRGPPPPAPPGTLKWVAYMKQRSCSCVAVNSRSRESVKELLNVARARIREVKLGESDCTGALLLVGIPNVGKSAIVNATHQIGRIGAAEKGKLKHAIVSSHPGETRGIIGYKVASHPNIYVLDTPVVLSPRFADDESASRLSLTGAIKDSLLQEYEIAPIPSCNFELKGGI